MTPLVVQLTPLPQRYWGGSDQAVLKPPTRPECPTQNSRRPTCFAAVRRYFYLLSRHLSDVHRMVRRHLELQDQYWEWMRRYPTLRFD